MRWAMAWFIRLKRLLQSLSERRKHLETASTQSDFHERRKLLYESEKRVCKGLTIRNLLTVDEWLEAEKEIIRSRFPNELGCKAVNS